jgi:integrase
LKQDVKQLKKYYCLYYENERGNYSYSSMKVTLSSLFLFFDMNDITLNKKEINRYLGEHTKTIKDSAYTREEIKKLIDACDLKYQVRVSFMVSNSC